MALMLSKKKSSSEIVYWSNPTTGSEEFPAQTITLPKACNKICIFYGTNNTSIDINNETYTSQYGSPNVSGILVLEKGETKTATIAGAGNRSYAFSADGASVDVGASSYQQSYETPCLILILE